MPRMNGIEATAKIRSGYPDTQVIGLSVNGSKAYQELMKRVGAIQLSQKKETFELLYDAIHQSL